jgi:hypothetical protein
LRARVSTPRIASATIAAGVACTARVVVMSAASFEIEKASSIVASFANQGVRETRGVDHHQLVD